MTILIGFQNQNFHAEVAGAPALSQHHYEEERVVSADLGGILGEVLCKDVAGLGFRKTSASGGAQNLGQFCALGCSPILPRPCQQGSPQTTLQAFRRVRIREGLARNALRTTEHAETQENRDLEASSWSRRAIFGPPDSIRRRVGRPTGRKAIYQAVWPRPQGQGRAGGRPLLHETLLLGSRNAFRTTEHTETRKIAIWRPRLGDPLTMSHFGAPDSIRRRLGRPFSRGGVWPRFSEPATWTGRPFIRLACNNAGGVLPKGSHSLKEAEEGKAGLLRAPWPRKAFWGPGKGQQRGCQPSQKSQASPL